MPMTSRDLGRRVAVAAFGIPLALYLIWTGGWPLTVGLALVAGLGAGEFFALARAGGFRPLAWVGVPGSAAMVLLAGGNRSFQEAAPWAMGRWEKRLRYYVEYVFEGLDEPGEWYLDRGTDTLYYYPLPGEEMTQVEATAPQVTSTLVTFQSMAPAGRSGFTYCAHHFPASTYSKLDCVVFSFSSTGPTVPTPGATRTPDTCTASPARPTPLIFSAVSVSVRLPSLSSRIQLSVPVALAPRDCGVDSTPFV